MTDGPMLGEGPTHARSSSERFEEAMEDGYMEVGSGGGGGGGGKVDYRTSLTADGGNYCRPTGFGYLHTCTPHFFFVCVTCVCFFFSCNKMCICRATTSSAPLRVVCATYISPRSRVKSMGGLGGLLADRASVVSDSAAPRARRNRVNADDEPGTTPIFSVVYIKKKRVKNDY